MPYTKSRARKTFEVELKSLQGAVRESHSKEVTNKRVRTHVLCSVLLLGTAKAEVYLQELVSDWLQAINGSPITTDKLPKELRAFLLVDGGLTSSLRRWVANQDEGRLLASVAGQLNRPHYAFAMDALALPPVRATQLLSGKKYPSPKNVAALFRRLGIPNMFDQMNRAARSDMEAKLQSYNDLRTQVAHQGVPPGINAGDIRAQLMSLSRIVRYTDRVMYRHVIRHSGVASWVV